MTYLIAQPQVMDTMEIMPSCTVEHSNDAIILTKIVNCITDMLTETFFGQILKNGLKMVTILSKKWSPIGQHLWLNLHKNT